MIDYDGLYYDKRSRCWYSIRLEIEMKGDLFYGKYIDC